MSDHYELTLVSAFIDDELSRDEATMMEKHLRSCDECRAEVNSLQNTKKIIRSAPKLSMPVELLAELKRAATEADRPMRPEWNWRSVWTLAGSMASIIVFVGLWMLHPNSQSNRAVPIESLIAAHSRYEVEGIPHERVLAASRYSAQLSRSSSLNEQKPNVQ